MALVSPGVEVTIIDESQYIPAATNSVPYILIATAQNKTSATGVGVAPGTLAANANTVYLITSQRDLAATYGNPFFYKTTAGTPINGYELNEYGLLAAYSALGITNRCYVQRVDIDLTELTASLTRPMGTPPNGVYWLDLSTTQWGYFSWNQTTAQFTNIQPTVLTNVNQLVTGTTAPLQSIGSIGDYAVTSVQSVTNNNPLYYKRGGPTSAQTSSTVLSDLYNSWVWAGSPDWHTSWPTISATLATSGSVFTPGDTILINGQSVTATGTTVAQLSTDINNAALQGVYSGYIGNKLYIYADNTSNSANGNVNIQNGNNDNILTLCGIATGTYYIPQFTHGYSYQAPRWNTTSTSPAGGAPTGSVWQKMNNVNLGMFMAVKKYSSTLGTFVSQACPAYISGGAALYGLDPSGGGSTIPIGTTYVQTDVTNAGGAAEQKATAQIFERGAFGATIATGTTTTPGPFVNNNTFGINYTVPGTGTYAGQTTITIQGTTIEDFLTSVSGAGLPSYISFSMNSAGALVISHTQGGDIIIYPGNNGLAPFTSAGFTTGTPFVRDLFNTTGAGLVISNWTDSPQFTYVSSTTAPDRDPADGRLWYYSSADQVDIMIQDNGEWMGYQNVSNDVRGYDLTMTNATGPICSATAPTTQNDASSSPLQYGDLWIDTSDLENYPMINRWENVEGVDQWVPINNTDQTTGNGVLFADARWAPNGSTDPIADPIPTIVSLLTSDYLDLDAPDPSLYPQGMLLWNSRRSGFNVKSFQVNYFNGQSFPDSSLPDVTNAWVTTSGLKADGSPYMGRQAQRALIVAALKSGIDTSTDIREEQRQFNLLACPQYPELMPNMIGLNNERSDTAFVIGDTPLRLDPQDILTWASNNNGLGLTTGDGLVSASDYMGVFYPSCQTTDLTGSPVVTAPSHMMIRTIIRSDEVSYPWLAPAGVRRGVIDNAVQIGYINATTGEFQPLGVNQGLRDVLYENAINPITFIPGVGITNFGNKTVTSVASAMDRINVARLVAYIRGRLETVGKQYLFEPNDQITRNQIKNSIDGLMQDLVAKRGLYDYLVVCDLTNNTPARIDRNELYVDIAIEPVKAVEFIYIPVRIKNTGAIAAGA